MVSTVTMPARGFAGSAPWGQVLALLALSVVFAVVSLRVVVLVYDSAVLKMGARLSLRNSIRTGMRRLPAAVGAAVGS